MKMIVTATEAHHGTLRAAGHVYDCTLGPSGVRAEKREGDGVTPVGVYPLRAIWYRADRIPQPVSTLPLHGIEQDDGWCDAPADPSYNRPVKLPYRASAEKMWRDDAVYDLVVILGHNDDPPVPGKGSAIFLHIANQAFGPTEGCIGLRREDLLTLAALMTPASVIDIRTG
jgi:L,D-peptidoglycan transpeptidase YkuD (ErfK/YbiS/YcfS/YnhG family)